MAFWGAQISVLLALLASAVLVGSSMGQRFRFPGREVNQLALMKRMAHSSTLSRRSQTELDTSNFVDVVSVEKRPTPQGTRFTVNLRKNTDEEVLCRIYRDTQYPEEPEPLNQGAGNMVSTTFVTNSSTDMYGRVYVLLMDSTYDHFMAIMLNNSASDETVTQQVADQVPIVSLTSGPEAVFDWGQNVTASAAVTVPGQRANMSNTHMSSYFYGVDLSTGEYHQYMSAYEVMTPTEPTFHGDTARASAEIHTGVRPVSGYAQLSTDFDLEDGTVIFTIQVARHILIRPSNQSGAFPPGYLSMVNDIHQEIAENGNALIGCPVGRPCGGHCAAVGEVVSDIQLFQVQPDGSLARDDDVNVVEEPSHSAQSLFWMFTAEEDSGNADGITTFECRAYGGGRGANRQVVTKRFDIQAQIPAVIDAERSGVTYTPDPETNMRYELTFRCAVEGRPTPQVTFTAHVSRDDYLYWAAPDNVVQTSPTRAVATKTVVVDVYYFNNVVAQMETGDLPWPTCDFSSPITYESVSHDFVLHRIR